MKTSFLNWIAEKELAQTNENEQELTTLYHGSVIDDIKNINNVGVHCYEGEFWATTNLDHAKGFALVSPKVDDISNPPPLAIFAFTIPSHLLQIMKEQGNIYNPEEGVYEFRSEACDQLNEFMQGKEVIPFEPNLSQAFGPSRSDIAA
jgi:hypothetical protein